MPNKVIEPVLEVTEWQALVVSVALPYFEVSQWGQNCPASFLWMSVLYMLPFHVFFQLQRSVRRFSWIAGESVSRGFVYARSRTLTLLFGLNIFLCSFGFMFGVVVSLENTFSLKFSSIAESSGISCSTHSDSVCSFYTKWLYSVFFFYVITVQL